MVALIGGRLLRRALTRGLQRTHVTPFATIVLGKILVYVAVVMGLSIALTILRLEVGPLIGALGLAGLAVAFAFQDILENFIAGVLMLMRRPIKVGEAYSTNLDHAQQVLQEAIKKVDGVADSPPATVEFYEFNNSSIDFYVRYWHPADRKTLWAVRHRAGRAMKKALDAAGIEIPFPQRTLWFPQGLGDRFHEPDSQSG
jgi:small-conductance mechanosensitive channel